jgi:hypothetical protein
MLRWMCRCGPWRSASSTRTARCGSSGRYLVVSARHAVLAGQLIRLRLASFSRRIPMMGSLVNLARFLSVLSRAKTLAPPGGKRQGQVSRPRVLARQPVAGEHAGPKAANAGHRRFSQQDGEDLAPMARESLSIQGFKSRQIFPRGLRAPAKWRATTRT